MSSEKKELRTIHFSPVRLNLDDVYFIEEMLQDYFGECIIISGWKKFNSADDLLGYLSKKNLMNFFIRQFCFRRICFKSPGFRIKMLRSRTIIELPEAAIKEGFYRKLIDHLYQRAERFRYFLFPLRVSLLLLVILAIPLSILHVIGFDNIYFVGMGMVFIGLVEILAFIISRVLWAGE